MPYTGLTAKLTIDGKDVGYISNWSVDETRDTIEVTKLGSKDKEIFPTLHYWSASAEGTADFADKHSQLDIRDAMVNGKEITVKFYLDTNAKNDTAETRYVYLEGSAYVTSFSVNISAEDKGGVSISLTGTKELSIKKTATDNGTSPTNSFQI